MSLETPLNPPKVSLASTVQMQGWVLARHEVIPYVIWRNIEVEFFRKALAGQDIWFTFSGADEGWVKGAMVPLLDEDDTNCDVNGWMQQAYLFDLPWVARDGEEVASYMFS